MRKVVLERFESGDEGTFGRIFVDGVLFYTGELPWRDNASNVSCIPAGSYVCKWTMSARFKKKMYEVGPVNGRAGIRIHSANLMGDNSKGFKAQLNGCIAIGLSQGWFGKQKALLLSAAGTRKFERLMEYKSFSLEVRDASDD